MALTIVSAAWLSFDRAAPFELLVVEPTAARAGEEIVLRATVRRDVDRGCSAVFSRYVYDAAGTRFDAFTGLPLRAGEKATEWRASEAMIDELEARMPGRLAIAITIPRTAVPGSASMLTVLHYSCNKTHWLVPIEVTTWMPFTVLP